MNSPHEYTENIVYEDNHLLIVNKQPGDIVQGDKTGDIPLLEHMKAYIKRKYDKPGNVFLGLVHRLDRPTGGLVIFARTSKALARLNKMLKDRKIEKTYLAVVKKKGLPASGTLEHFLKKNERQNKSFPVGEHTSGAKKAVLHYRAVAYSDTYALLRVKLETGRHHQIRAQLAATGYPLVGDLKYGYPRPLPDRSIALWAYQLEFDHPVGGEKVSVTAGIPGRDVWKYFDIS